MIISDHDFKTFLKCITKFHLLKNGFKSPQHEYTRWKQKVFEVYQKNGFIELTGEYQNKECSIGICFPTESKNINFQIAIQPKIRTHGIISIPDAVRSIKISNRKELIPIRFSINEKLSKTEKLLVTFDAVAMKKVTGKSSSFGEIIHGERFVRTKVKTETHSKTVSEIIMKIRKQLRDSSPPELILSKHCPECMFEKTCFQSAKEKDELTLLSRMTTKERQKFHDKGIFTVTALSYTFRPRKPHKKAKDTGAKFNHALKALAIRENKIYVTGSPKLKMSGTLVYLDIEGVPDKDIYYLVGVRVNGNDTIHRYSFWANDRSEEIKIWRQLYQLLLSLNEPKIFHYGNYEKIFFNRMKARYPKTIEDIDKLEAILSGSTNLVKVIYGSIYFPVYTNSLKDVAKYFGYNWSDPEPSGLKSLLWRNKWETEHSDKHRDKLEKYNLEDCEALEVTTKNIHAILYNDTANQSCEGSDIIRTESMKQRSPYNWGEFLGNPELVHINKCSYWNYQRNKIYIKTNPSLKRVVNKTKRKKRGKLKINKAIEPSIPLHCPNCEAAPVYKYAYNSKILYDLKFTNTGIKRWVEKYHTVRYHCRQCDIIFSSDIWFQSKHRYGWGLVSFIIYHIIEMSVPQAAVARIINQLFGYSIHSGRISHLKTRAAEYYLETYDSIKKKLFSGKVIYADETRANVDGKTAYVWVFTSLTEVIFIFSETREAETLKTNLENFKGVLVSDFYSAYDSIDCDQQKCLIHLIRDFNDELLRHPFNEELKVVTHEFASLLKPILATIDRFGLKKYYLKKHKTDVSRFYKKLDRYALETEITRKIKKRLDKHREKLFTFLDHNNIAWNNNNAEHAIKAFARLRRILGGNTNEKGLQEYLTLLSICQTCKYNEINFMSFLRSENKEIKSFIKNN